MFANITFRSMEKISHPIISGSATATICVEVVAVVDGQYNDLGAIVSHDSFQLGSATFFHSWTERSMIVTPNYFNDTIHVTVTGLARWDYTDPVVGITATYTSEHILTCTFTA